MGNLSSFCLDDSAYIFEIHEIIPWKYIIPFLYIEFWSKPLQRLTFSYSFVASLHIGRFRSEECSSVDKAIFRSLSIWLDANPPLYSLFAGTPSIMPYTELSTSQD